jgi:hypothetical protein
MLGSSGRQGWELEESAPDDETTPLPMNVMGLTKVVGLRSQTNRVFFTIVN